MLPAVTRLPHAPGVYRFRGRGGRELYLGRAIDLRRRVGSYWGDLRDRRHLRRMMLQVERVEAVICDSDHEAAWLERNLLERRLPPWNRTRGEEVPVYVRVDGRPRSPGVGLAYRVSELADVTHFGPYLGSARTQRAVDGLERVLPLRLTAEGGWGDLARVRGVSTDDRVGLLLDIRSVLAREPGAVSRVRQELHRRRDVAAAALAFERAGQLQAELAALDWLLAEQKVTSMVLDDIDVAGWADGVLSAFEVRAGRLGRWCQRRCSAATARPSLAATPAGWVDFAERNARLAADLAG